MSVVAVRARSRWVVAAVVLIAVGGGLLVARVSDAGCPGAGITSFRCDEYALVDGGGLATLRTRVWFEALNGEPLAIARIRSHALSIVLRHEGAATISRGIETESLDGCGGGSVCREQGLLSRFFSRRVTWTASGERLVVRSAAGALVLRATGVQPPR